MRQNRQLDMGAIIDGGTGHGYGSRPGPERSAVGLRPGRRSCSRKRPGMRMRGRAARSRWHVAGVTAVALKPLQLKVHGRLEELRQPAPYRLSHEGQPAGRRTGGDCPLGSHGPVRADCARARRAAEVRPARRPAVRQRPDPHRPRAQQDPQGLRRQVEVDGRLRRAVRAGLGLPRPADRSCRSTRNSARRSAR